MERTNKSIYLKKPTLEELAFTEELLADPETMSFNNKWGGTVAFPKEKWQEFYNRYMSNNPKYLYFHIYNLDHTPVGEVSTRYQEDNDAYMLNIKIMAKYRGNHHGYDALELFLQILFDEYQAEKVIDDVALDNIGGASLMKQFGLWEIGRTDEAIILSLTKAEYNRYTDQ